MVNDADRMTAFEALVEWCEKYLEPEEYKVVPETDSYCATIYFDNHGTQSYLCFFSSGAYSGAGEVDDDEMEDHLEEAAVMDND